MEGTALRLLAAELTTEWAGAGRAVQAADCQGISADIYTKTGISVSVSTLKRFYGFNASVYNISGMTKNALCNYLGYGSWAEFQLKKTGPATDKEPQKYWSELRKKAAGLSRYTWSALKNRSGIPYKYTIDRSFAEDHLLAFLNSRFLATSFIAPGGYGKTILLSRLVEKFWLSPERVFPNDIVWFISGQTIGGLQNKGFDLNEWFIQEMGMAGHETVRDYFSARPEEIRGRLVLILDGFDEIVHKEAELQTHFSRVLDFVSLNQDFPWIKIIISVRSNTWAYVADQINDSSFIRDSWFLGPTFIQKSQINVPLLNEPEMHEVLANLSGEVLNEHGFSTEMLRQLANPFYVQLLYQLKMICPGSGIIHEKFDYFDLVSEFIMVKIYQNRFSSEKISIIKRFLEFTRLGSQQDYVEKNLLIPEQDDLRRGYQELISYGVLVEENLSSNLVFKNLVYVNHLNLLEYFIAMELLTNHRHQITAALFADVVGQYSSSRYKLPLLKWLIYFAVKNEQVAGFPDLTTLSIPPAEQEILISFLRDLQNKRALNKIQDPLYSL